MRRAGFWTLDGVKGRPTRHHLDDIRTLMVGGTASRARLDTLLDHAVRTTPFYAGFAGRDLEAFPVVDRMAYKQRSTEFHSSEYADSKVRIVTTSGTSGTPLTIRQDLDKRRRTIADTIFFNETFGQRIGDRLLWLRAWTPDSVKPRHVQIAQNVVPFEVVGMTEAVMDDIVRVLGGGRVNAILGFATSLWALARHINKEGYDARAFGLGVIINDSESLDPAVKRRLEATFGCPVVDRYANIENGILAATAPDDDRYRVNHASYWLEFLKLESDEPQVPGQPARVVVTDLFNRAMPIIRYDTGPGGGGAQRSGPEPDPGEHRGSTRRHHLRYRRP